jgi:Methyltransferase domain
VKVISIARLMLRRHLKAKFQKRITMNQLQNTVISVLSPEMRNYLRRAYYKSVPNPIRSIIQGGQRDEVFQRAMVQYLKNPGACAQPGNPVLQDLIYGWGNEAWSAMDEYLAGCIEYALSTRGPILECGTGLSTLLLGAVAKRQCQSHWALEHKSKWALKVQSYLNRYKLASVIHLKPLKNYGDFCWYDVPMNRMPDSFFLVVCDGPPSRTKGGRFGLIPIMRERLKSGCVILLDDAEREAELDIAKRWEAELDSSFNIQGKLKPYINMAVA